MLKPIVSNLSDSLLKFVRVGYRMSGFELEKSASLKNLFQNRAFPILRHHSFSSDPYCIPFEIDITAITTTVGFSFAKEGWHPFLETLEEYANDLSLSYEQSTMFRLYNYFIPQNFCESLFTPSIKGIKPLTTWPCYGQLLANIWLLNHRKLKLYLNYLKPRTGLKGNVFYGPHSLDQGKQRFNRLISLYESIKNTGFVESLQNDPINGYFLEKDDELRFVLVEGNHRVSVLKKLGCQKAKVTISSGFPCIIRYNNLEEWITKNRIVYDTATAKKIFLFLFYESGQNKALDLGLFSNQC